MTVLPPPPRRGAPGHPADCDCERCQYLDALAIIHYRVKKGGDQT